jgi:hypothetical protein
MSRNRVGDSVVHSLARMRPGLVPCVLALAAALPAAEGPDPPPAVFDEASRHPATPAQPNLAPAANSTPVAVSDDAETAMLAALREDAAFLRAAGRAREAAQLLRQGLAANPRADAAMRSLASSELAATEEAEIGENDDATRRARLAAAAGARERLGEQGTIALSARTERLARIRDLQRRGHRELALAHCRTLQSDLPLDDEVDALFRELLGEAHDARRAVIAERERDLRIEVAARLERSLIPEGFDGRPIWPSDWDQVRAGRTSPLDAISPAPAWFEAVEDRLAQRASVQFDGTPFADAVDLVARLSGVNIVTAPEVLATEGRIVSLRVGSMPLGDILTWIVEQAGTRWTIANGGVFIGEGVEAQRTIIIHDISGLIVAASDFPGLSLAWSAGSGTGGGTPTLFTTAEPSDVAVPTADDIADLIKRSIAPTIWSDAANQIAVRGNTLLITAPEEVQRLVREFIRAQEAQRALAVRVDLRWLEITDSYIEEIGVRWNNGQGDMIDLGPGNRRGWIHAANGWAFDGATTNPLPASAMASASSVGNTGLTLQTAMLGQHKVSAILSALHHNTQGRVVQAPEVTCLNGQRANCFFGNQLAYISDYEVVGGAYDPVISVLNLGTMLDVRPLVSADRKYVTLELRSAVATATLFVETIFAIQILGVNGAGAAVGASSSYPIELPNVSLRTFGTSVMVPDRGSMLVGGFGRSIDQFSAVRVPMLGSIPFLGRLFGARGRYSDRLNLYLLTTATVISYPELEARL